MPIERGIVRPTGFRARAEWEKTNACILLGAIPLVMGRNRQGAVPFVTELTKRELPAYVGIVRDTLAGRPIKISDEINDLADHKISFVGEHNLDKLRGRSFFLVANHQKKGPLGGSGWHAQGESYSIQQRLGREITWVQGAGKEKFHPILEGLGLHDWVSEHVIEPVHARIAAVNGSIHANGKNNTSVGRKAISEVNHEEIVAWCPEGLLSESLAQGNAQVGELLYGQAEKGIPAIGVTSFQDGDELVIVFTDVIEPEIIRRSFEKGFTDENRGQAVIDFIFGAYLAQKMPKHLRGYYTSYPAVEMLLTPSVPRSQVPLIAGELPGQQELSQPQHR